MPPAVDDPPAAPALVPVALQPAPFPSGLDPPSYSPRKQFRNLTWQPLGRPPRCCWFDLPSASTWFHLPDNGSHWLVHYILNTGGFLYPLPLLNCCLPNLPISPRSLYVSLSRSLVTCTSPSVCTRNTRPPHQVRGGIRVMAIQDTHLGSRVSRGGNVEPTSQPTEQPGDIATIAW